MKNKLLYGWWLGCSVIALSCLSCHQETRFPKGKAMYTQFCENCHMEDGTGLVGIIPPLAGADYLKNNPNMVPCIIHRGIGGEMTVNGKVYRTVMPGQPQLGEFEVTNIINYINTAWDNNLPTVKHEEVRALLLECDSLASPVDGR